MAATLVASLLTAVYWWAVFFVVYADALFAGDRAPWAPPATGRDATVTALLTIGGAVLLYAALSAGWRMMGARIASRPSFASRPAPDAGTTAR